MEIFLLILAMACIIGGIIFSVLPPLPGPILSFLGIILTHFSSVDRPFSIPWMIFFGIAVALVTILDLFMPVIATKKFGGTKSGIYGGLIGTLVGMIVPIPFGILWGPLMGAIIGDLIGGNQIRAAIKSGVGSFLGFVIATILKLVVSVSLGIAVVWQVGAVVTEAVMSMF
jgi:uncharacterized protein YqgC (DUF456 family)